VVQALAWAYTPVIWRSRMVLSQRSESLRITAANCAGLIGAGLAPRARMTSITGVRVSAAAQLLCVVPASNPARPGSAKVVVSGSH